MQADPKNGKRHLHRPHTNPCPSPQSLSFGCVLKPKQQLSPQ